MPNASTVRSFNLGALAAALLALTTVRCGGDSARSSTGGGASPASSGSDGSGGSGGSGGGSGGGPVQPSAATLLVQILDDSGKPISSALVTSVGAAKPSLSDGFGYVLFEHLAPGRFSARVERTGFAPAAIGVDLPKGAHAGTELRLLPLPKPIAFVADKGARLDKGSVHVAIPPAALLDRNGAPVTGSVEATIVAIDPAAGLTTLPGPLEGKTSTGGTVSLESVGMAEVTIRQNGLPVQLAPGAKASLEMVLPEAMVPKVHVGDTIPAWWLDLDAGVWREDGLGVVQPSMAEPGKLAWIAQVSHFTWWNCDYPWYDKNCFIVPVVAPDGTGGVSGQPVGAEGVSYQGMSTPVFTDAFGKACVNIKLGGTAKIFVGPADAPFASAVVTGTGPAGDCAGNGASCVVLDPALTVPFNAVCTPGDRKDCGSYGGPPGTLGVGICTGPSQVCNCSGTAWSTCGGEVLPQPESCATPVDDDCDGLTNEEGSDCTCTPGEAVACYTGPKGTIGVGLCHGGMRTCQSDGQGYGPCDGQVLPAIEGCDTPNVDEDCDGKNACIGGAYWSKVLGDPATQTAMDVAVDGAGNTLVTGYFDLNTLGYGAIDFGGGPLKCVGGNDIFLAKLDTQGHHVWSKRFGDAQYQEAYGVAVDAAGDVVLRGSSNGTVDFGGGPFTIPDGFVAKFDAQGNHLWSKQLNGGHLYGSDCLTVDGAGNILLAEVLSGTADLGGGPLQSAGGYDILMAKLDPQGNHLWSKRFGDSADQRPTGMSVDGAGNIVLAGSFAGTVDFGGGPLTSPKGDAAFVAKFDAQGNHLWSKPFGGNSSSGIAGAAVDAAGNVVLAGNFYTTIDLGGGPLTNTDKLSAPDIFAAKFDPQGKHLWSEHFSGNGEHNVLAMAVDAAGTILLTGRFAGGLDFGGGYLPNLRFPFTNSYDIFAAKLDPMGGHLWSMAFSNGSVQSGFAAAMDSAGNGVITGSLMDQVDFGNGTLHAHGLPDVFLVRLKP